MLWLLAKDFLDDPKVLQGVLLAFGQRIGIPSHEELDDLNTADDRVARTGLRLLVGCE